MSLHESFSSHARNTTHRAPRVWGPTPAESLLRSAAYRPKKTLRVDLAAPLALDSDHLHALFSLARPNVRVSLPQPRYTHMHRDDLAMIERNARVSLWNRTPFAWWSGFLAWCSG